MLLHRNVCLFVFWRGLGGGAARHLQLGLLKHFRMLISEVSHPVPLFVSQSEDS